ncbi:hypothetical protein [Frankia sp. AgB32]|uniref:hypothetical protein n=1 Tax=Frankia sp. AgB32 TaxID=631119 RepID=UPI0020106A5E|nr:hypothetical protein [Frankia sp. AgB32]MCK9897715.1 hypothetical protein [Frankia sp. AgB32]
MLTSGCGGGKASPPVSAPTGTAAARGGTSRPAVVAGTTSHPVTLHNLTVTPAVRGELVRAYVVDRGYQPGWIVGTEPGSVYYAYDPSTSSYLAWAGFVPAATAPQQVGVGLQDDGSRTAFRRTAGGSWQVYDICTTPRFLAFVGGRLPAGGTCPAP